MVLRSSGAIGFRGERYGSAQITTHPPANAGGSDKNGRATFQTNNNYRRRVFDSVRQEHQFPKLRPVFHQLVSSSCFRQR